jgi:hypothetical protein
LQWSTESVRPGTGVAAVQRPADSQRKCRARLVARSAYTPAMRRLRPLRNAIITIGAGALVGYAAVAFGTYVLGSGTAAAPDREPRDVHAFVETYVVRAASNPETITYLGGTISDGVGIHLYAVGLRDTAGQSVLEPIKLTFAGGRVIRID